jgi:hypothetical protein
MMAKKRRQFFRVVETNAGMFCYVDSDQEEGEEYVDDQGEETRSRRDRATVRRSPRRKRGRLFRR